MFNKLIEFIKNNKKRIIFIFGVLIGLILLFMIGRSIYYNYFADDPSKIRYEFNKYNKKKSKEDDERYPKVDISSDNLYVYTDDDEIINLINNKGDGVIFIGSPDCAYSRHIFQILHDTAKDTELEKILYLDIDKKYDRYDELKSTLGEKFIEDGEIYSPLVLFVADGKIVSYKKGTLILHKNGFDEMTDGQIEGLKIVYEYGIRDVVISINNKK